MGTNLASKIFSGTSPVGNATTDKGNIGSSLTVPGPKGFEVVACCSLALVISNSLDFLYLQSLPVPVLL